MEVLSIGGLVFWLSGLVWYGIIRGGCFLAVSSLRVVGTKPKVLVCDFSWNQIEQLYHMSVRQTSYKQRKRVLTSPGPWNGPGLNLDVSAGAWCLPQGIFGDFDVWTIPLGVHLSAVRNKGFMSQRLEDIRGVPTRVVVEYAELRTG